MKKLSEIIKNPEKYTWVIDNDCFYVYETAVEDGDSQSFDIGPTELVFILGEELGLNMTMV